MKFSHLIRIYTNASLTENQIITITGADCHYLKSVMRLRKGQNFRLFNQIDGEYLVKILEISRSDVIVLIESLLHSIYTQSPLSLGICIIKPHRMIEAIKGAVQLGVTTIIPIISERTQYKKISSEKIKKSIIQEIEQSEHFILPELFPEITLNNFLQKNNDKQIIVAFESENANNKILKIRNIASDPIILIGPEGGFSESEIKIIKSLKNTITVSLGNSILRTEIAAISAISCIKMIKNDTRLNH